MLKYLNARLQWNLAKYIDLKKPAHLDLELTTKCRLNCVFCYRNEVKFQKKNIDHDLAIAVLEQAEEIGIPSAKFNWRGEATENDNIFIYLENFKKFYFMLNTALPMPLPHGKLEVLSRCVDDLKISVDSAGPDIYCQIRKGMTEPAFKRLKEDIEFLTVLRQQHDMPKLTISRRTSKLTEPETDEQFKKAFKGVRFDIKPATPRNNEDIYQMDTNDKRYVYSNRKYCGQPSRRLVIDVDGNAYACCVAYKAQPELYLGNVNDESILDIWNGDKRHKLVKELKLGILNKACAECTSNDI